MPARLAHGPIRQQIRPPVSTARPLSLSLSALVLRLKLTRSNGLCSEGRRAHRGAI